MGQGLLLPPLFCSFVPNIHVEPLHLAYNVNSIYVNLEEK